MEIIDVIDTFSLRGKAAKSKRILNNLGFTQYSDSEIVHFSVLWAQFRVALRKNHI